MKQTANDSSSNWQKAFANGNSSNSHRLLTHKRSIIIGALILFAVIALAGGGAALDNDTPGQFGNRTSVNSQSTSPDSTPAPDPQDPKDEANGNVSTSVSSQTVNGVNNTQVTVNGQSVPVPQNGTVDKTVGNTSVHIETSSSNSGNSTSVSTPGADFDHDFDHDIDFDFDAEAD